MKLKPVLTLGLALSGLALAAPQRYEMQSYVNIGGKVQPAFAWCDARDAVVALTTPQSGQATLAVWEKGRGHLLPPNTFPATVGDPDPGAGQIYYPLTWKNGAATVKGFLHTSNIENVQDPAYRMTHINEFRLSDLEHSCRYVPQAAFMGATNKRTVIVWDNGKTATYATRNFDGTPGVYVTGGQKRQQAEATVYEFKTEDGYTYQLKIAPQEYSGNAELSVLRQGQVIQTEPFLAYSISLPAKGQP
ncbi:hypothetical protein [Deinococcus aluminii]|uniref:Uncharacterized protein n=1 Tax=Deinococcus aluminii TaxID=1656885 RepID=A0ABP9XH64_9DEIO